MPDAERLDPSLLPEGEGDEEPELDELGHGEVLVEPLPERGVSDLRIPNDGARVGERDLLASAELVGVGEAQQLVVLLFGEPFPSPLDGALDASVVALDGFRDVDAAELLDGVVEDAMAKRLVPRLRERVDDGRVVRADRLALGPRRSFATRQLQVAEDVRISDRRWDRRTESAASTSSS